MPRASGLFRSTSNHDERFLSLIVDFLVVQKKIIFFAIRDYGQLEYWKNPERLKGYASEYVRTRRKRKEADDKAEAKVEDKAKDNKDNVESVDTPDDTQSVAFSDTTDNK